MILAHLFHHRFPRTYPTNAHPIFTVQQPIRGIPDDCIARLSNYIQAEARQSRGTEIVFQVSKLLTRRAIWGLSSE
jgi:eukaryotic translation initiation factor 2-alpha kinase 4